MARRRLLGLLIAAVVALGTLAAARAAGGSPPAPPVSVAHPKYRPVKQAGSIAKPGPNVMFIVEENHSAGDIIGSPAAPFMNHLAATGVQLTSAYGVRHPSLPNYIALVTGTTAGITSDCNSCYVSVPNLVDQLQASGLSWHGYMEGLPKACSKVNKAGLYVKRHDPFMYLNSVRNNPARCAKVVPLSRLLSDAGHNRLPRYSFVVPNLIHDMHNGTVQQADAWVKSLVTRLQKTPAWTKHDLRVVLTFDEDDHSTSGCCGVLGAGGHIATIVFGPRISHGVDGTTYTLYSLLRSVENVFGLPPLGYAAQVPPVPALASP